MMTADFHARTRRLIDLEAHRAIFTWVLQCLSTGRVWSRGRSSEELVRVGERRFVRSINLSTSGLSGNFVLSCFRGECSCGFVFPRLSSRKVNDAAPEGDVDRGGAVLHVQLREDVLHVHLRGLLADAERGGDFLVPHALRR